MLDKSLIYRSEVIVLDTNHPDTISYDTIRLLKSCLEANDMKYAPDQLAYKVVANFTENGDCISVDVYPLNKTTLQPIYKSDQEIVLDL